jgi:hypothetical protein
MNYILFDIFIILQYFDFWTTYNVIKTNKGHEGNPIMAWLFSKIGVIGGFVVMKSIVIIAVWFIKDILLIIILLNVIYVYVVYMNYRILKS